MNTRQLLEHEVQDKILEVANLFNDVTYSDLQGLAFVAARKIIDGVLKIGPELESESKGASHPV